MPPPVSFRSFRGNQTSTVPLESKVSVGKAGLRQRASEVFSRPFSRGHQEIPTPPPSRGEQDPFDRQYPPAPYVRPGGPDSYSLQTREEFRKTPIDAPTFRFRHKNDVVSQRITECAILAKFSPAHYESWITYFNSYADGCFNLNNLPQEPFLNEDWEYLPALYPCSELTRQAVADVLCVNQYTSAQVKSAEKILRDAMAYLGAETYTVSTFDELTESWQFSYGTQGWPETEKKRSCSLAAHALLSSREALVVLDTEMDWRFSKNPLVSDGPQVRSFIAAPMLAPSGEVVAILAFYSQYPRQRFTVQNHRELSKYNEELFSTIWLGGHRRDPLPTTPVRTAPRPFSGSDLTSVNHIPGPCTPEQGVATTALNKALNLSHLHDKLNENVPDSPTLGSSSPDVICTPSLSRKDDYDDVLCFLSRYERQPDQVKRESMATELTHPSEPEDENVVAAQVDAALLLWAQALNFDALYIVHLDPDRLRLSDEELEAGGMNMSVLASIGLPKSKALDVAIHLKALRAPNTATLLTHDEELHCSRTFLMPLTVRQDEPVEWATEGVIFGGYRRMVRELVDSDSLGMDPTEIRTLHRLCRILRKTLDINDSPSHTRINSGKLSSRYPANEAKEFDIPTPSARYPANEAMEVDVPRPFVQLKPSSSLQDFLSGTESPQPFGQFSRVLQPSRSLQDLLAGTTMLRSATRRSSRSLQLE